jgi:hypothetical protein
MSKRTSPGKGVGYRDTMVQILEIEIVHAKKFTKSDNL